MEAFFLFGALLILLPLSYLAAQRAMRWRQHHPPRPRQQAGGAARPFRGRFRNTGGHAAR